ncbi:hypothetical protein PI125_g24178 [Phytophthora idaei]|nr:hypothetical protein PI125_g24178 [Phytophthora idaei]
MVASGLYCSRRWATRHGHRAGTNTSCGGDTSTERKESRGSAVVEIKAASPGALMTT